MLNNISLTEEQASQVSRIARVGIPGLPTLTDLLWVSQIHFKSHDFTATQANLTRGVNI